MKQASCSQEESVVRAVGAGSWPEALAAHAEECAICRDVARTARAMRTLASSLDERDLNVACVISHQVQPLPDPELVWQRARLDKEHGKNRLLFANPASPKREKMTVRLSYDEGKTWPVAKEINAGPSAYSALAVLPDMSIA